MKPISATDSSIFSRSPPIVAFVAEIDREPAARPPGERNILLFIHGYNNTASDAILRLGQFVEDTGFQGLPVLFTWASASITSRYVYSLNRALIARVGLRQMADILTQTRARQVEGRQR